MKKEIFYHYTSIDGLYGIIEDKSIHATNINFLNDPSEEEYFNDLLISFLNKNDEADKVYSILYNSSYENNYDNYDKYIISFSSKSDSLPMWNYYSKGNGYNLGFCIDNIINRKKGLSAYYYRKINIVYDQASQFIALIDFFEKYKDEAEKYIYLSDEMEKYENLNQRVEYELTSQEQSEIIISFMEEFATLRKSFKHPSYANENEVRLLIEIEHQFNQIYYRKTNSGLLIPYIKIPIILNEDINSITLHPIQNELGMKGLIHFLKNKNIDLRENIKISKIPYREI